MRTHRVTEAELRRRAFVDAINGRLDGTVFLFNQKDALIREHDGTSAPIESHKLDRAYYSGRRSALQDVLDLIEQIL